MISQLIREGETNKEKKKQNKQTQKKKSVGEQ